MNTKKSVSVLIVEPNKTLTAPYIYLPQTYHITHVSTIIEGQHFLFKNLPDIVMVSASLRVEEVIHLLETLKENSHSFIPAVIFVIDFSHRLSVIPGLHWAGKSQVLSTHSQKQEVESILI